MSCNLVDVEGIEENVGCILEENVGGVLEETGLALTVLPNLLNNGALSCWLGLLLALPFLLIYLN